MPTPITWHCGCREWYLIADNADELTEVRCAACGKKFLGAVSAKPLDPSPSPLMIARPTPRSFVANQGLFWRRIFQQLGT
jgi:hypothetical protein